MKINKICVGKFKYIENLAINLSGYEEEFSNRKYNLSVMIGQNGTSKTTILQMLENLFEKDEKDFYKFNQMYDLNCSYDIEYEKNGKLCKKNSGYFSVDNDIEAHYLTNSLFDKSKKSRQRFGDSNLALRKIMEIFDGQLGDKYIIQTKEYQKFLSVFNSFDKFKDSKVFFEIRRRPSHSRRFYDDHINNEENKKIFENLMNDLKFLKDEFYLDIRKTYNDYDINRLFNSVSSAVYRAIRNNFRERYGRGDIIKSNRKSSINVLFDLNNKYAVNLINEYRRLEEKYEIERSEIVISNMWLNLHENIIPFSELSSGELSYLLQLVYIEQNISNNTIFLIDEPEISLHPSWIKEYISRLDKICNGYDCHVIIATHSPMLVNNISKEELIGLYNTKKRIKQVEFNENPIGLSMDSMLKEIFETDVSNTEYLNEYFKKIEKYLKSDKTSDKKEGFSMYEELSDSPMKFKLFRVCKEEIMMIKEM